MNPPLGHVVTFYSYKGGVGRTFALADVAIMLARWGYSVLCVDWDLEAPGLHAFFRDQLPAEPGEGVLELCSAWRTLAPEEAAAKGAAVHLEAAGALTLLPAGLQDETYSSRLQQAAWGAWYADGMGDWVEKLRSAWQRRYDFVLIDSRTGLSDTAGICSIHLPNILVLLTSPNAQSVEGVQRVGAAAREAQSHMPVDRARLRVVPVPTRIDSSEYEAQRHWTATMRERLIPFIDQWSDAPERSAELLDELSVPYWPYFSYGEHLPALKEDGKSRLSVSYAHETLARLLAKELSGVAELLDDRREGVPRAGQIEMADVYISASVVDWRVRALQESLEEEGFVVTRQPAKADLDPGDPLDLARPKPGLVEAARSYVILLSTHPDTAQETEIARILQLTPQPSPAPSSSHPTIAASRSSSISSSIPSFPAAPVPSSRLFASSRLLVCSARIFSSTVPRVTSR
jgi:MinD-like ATPase involved in chromosome partitioning or flagellar assembly